MQHRRQLLDVQPPQQRRRLPDALHALQCDSGIIEWPFGVQGASSIQCPEAGPPGCTHEPRRQQAPQHHEALRAEDVPGGGRPSSGPSLDQPAPGGHPHLRHPPADHLRHQHAALARHADRPRPGRQGWLWRRCRCCRGRPPATDRSRHRRRWGVLSPPLPPCSLAVGSSHSGGCRGGSSKSSGRTAADNVSSTLGGLLDSTAHVCQ
mmetsp:Transcript_61540/g.156328  ORF Transcript_61540/g.156328 Transcript_61540/m.156328 type:complete len:207 (+) Transcript_61540:546-1166(+)